MRRPALFGLLAVILGIISLLMLPALIFAVVIGESAMIRAFVVPMAVCACLALPSVLLIRRRKFTLDTRDGFLMVFMTWVLASLAGSIPYLLSGLGISFTDSFFESACGFATTGGTTLANVEILPASLHLWRSISHWAGGMGIILLTVALMPLLGVGGFALIKAETPGPEKEKLSPRITAAAKALWGTYVVLTLVLVVLYAAGGMTALDAVCHGLTTMATGGVSTRNSGLAHYDSPFIDVVTIIFMLAASINFNIYYRILKGRIGEVLHHTETRAFLLIFAVASLIIALNLTSYYGSFGRALRYGSYMAGSIITTTGSDRLDFTAWPVLSQAVLFILMFIGGCSGSTAGGIKVIRHAVLFKQAINETRRILYPQGVFSIRLNRKVGRKDVVYGVAGFVFLYMCVIAVTTLVGASGGLDLFSSFSAALSVTGNVGLGFGLVGPGKTFAAFPDYVKWFYSLIMITGRLELWTVIILFTPEYRRRLSR